MIDESKHQDSDFSLQIIKADTHPRKILEQTDVRLSEFSIKEDSSSPKRLAISFPNKLHRWFRRQYYKNHMIITVAWFIFILVLFTICMNYAIKLNWAKTKNNCEGIKLLSYVSITTLILLFYFVAFKPIFGSKIGSVFLKVSFKVRNTLPIVQSRLFSLVCGCSICCIITIVIVLISQDYKYRLISFGGIIVLFGLGYLFSKQRKWIDWNLIIWGLTMQFVFACLLLRWKTGRLIMECISNKVALFIVYTDRGTEKIFGYLVTGKMEFANGNDSEQSFILGFKIFTIVIFFALTAAVLFHYGILQWIIIKLGWFLHKGIGSTAIESMTAAANVFLGMTEAPLTVKPYLKRLTAAELHSVMTSGFATIAGTVLVAYIAMGINGTHLLTASLMSSPAALIFSKLLYPETEISLTTPMDIQKLQTNTGEQSVLEVAVRGIYEGVILYGNIIANLISFISLIKIVDSFLEFLGSLVGVSSFNSQWILAFCFTPLAFIMGVEWDDCGNVAELIGIKTVVNEFVGFIRLIELRDQAKLSYRSQMIATYALCGFSNFGSIGIMIGGFGAMVPERLSDITSLALRAMIAGSAACFLTACVAGTIMEDYTEGMTLYMI
uniref:Sodium/nucleoside cotransporter n=1 Tax=Strigamia maritima TaxID=126957 RepID=T1J659_STRMM